MAEKPTRFFNRELSWLEFNRRVLEEACDPATPLLERLKFLAITASNLDEFFMVRVGSLQQLIRQGHDEPDPAGLPPPRQLSLISEQVRRLTSDQHDCLLAIEAALATHGARRLAPEQLSPEQIRHVETIFYHEIFPLLTPLAASAPAPFPPLPGLALCLLLRLRASAPGKTTRYAIIPLPRNLNRIISLQSDKGIAYMMTEDAVRMHLDVFFPGELILEAVPFRLTRNADLAIREDLAGDLLDKMRKVLTERRESHCVRLEISAAASQEARRFLQRALHLSPDGTHDIREPLALSAFFKLGLSLGAPSLLAPAWDPIPSRQAPATESMFSILTRQDILLCHPFESFEPVERLIDQAADDPDVLAIKQILYRTSPDSPIVASLVRAAEHGKQVTVIVELKARFDEARNINWAGELEQAGAQVIYGIKGLKTHAKLCMIIRREAGGIRRYLHFGTGNYNEVTARLYTDVSYMTSNETLAADASLFFNTITGYAQPAKYHAVEAAPIGLRDRLLDLIAGETARAAQGQEARIMAKLNSLVDPPLIEALYAASQAGVTIRLNVRGTCALRPGVPGLSETISVVSIVDRFLEHSRIMYFHHGGEPRIFISSADWMPRNLDRRIELLVPVESEPARTRLVSILETCLADTVKGRLLQPDGRYVRSTAKPGETPLRSQETLYNLFRRLAQSPGRPVTVFQPHRPETRP
jgi:polyphosphate kinase